MQLSLDRFFDMATIERGLVYARQGQVQRLEYPGENGELVAAVKGSGRNSYSMTLFPRFDAHGTLTMLQGGCSCPVGARCKHMVAALVVLGARSKSAAAAAQPGAAVVPAAPGALPSTMSAPLRSWLRELEGLDLRPADTSPRWPDTVRDRLLYVLELDIWGRIGVAVMKTTVLRDGRLSSSARRYDVEALRRATSRPQFVLREDMDLLHALEAAGVPANAGGYMLADRGFRPEGPPDLFAVLARIAATGRGRWEAADGPELTLAPPRATELRWDARSDGSQVLGLWARPAEGRPAEPLRALPLATPCWIDPETGAFGQIETALPPAVLGHLLRAPEIPADHAASVAAVLEGLDHPLLPVPRALGVSHREGRAPVPVLRLGVAKGQVRFEEDWREKRMAVVVPALELGFSYAGQIAPGGADVPLRFREGDTQVVLSRDKPAEAAAWQALEGLGALLPKGLVDHSFPPSSKTTHVFVDDEWDAVREALSEAVHDALRFVDLHVPALRARGWQVEIDPAWPLQLDDTPAQISARVGAEGGGGLFDFGVKLVAGEQELDLAPMLADLLARLPRELLARGLPQAEAAEAGEAEADLQALIAALPQYVSLPDGRFSRVDPRHVATLLGVMLTHIGLLTRLHPAEAGQLHELAEALEGSGIAFEASPALMELGARLRALRDAPAPLPPAALKAELRPYQRAGFGWLAALSDCGFGGLLADDMGLGKTMQTLALLARCHLEVRAGRPSLLVVPTSLAQAWARQAAQFLPDLKVLVLQGPARKNRFDDIATADLVISTYPLLSRDHAVLEAQDWELVILDEAQAIKNPTATAARRVRALRGRMRLALTGTPMENSLTDLWTLFDWLIPGLLGDRKRFRAEVATPIEKQGDAQARDGLNRRLAPFMLRRTKAEVASELPEKTEITELVSLGERQQALYETVRMAMDARVREAIAARGMGSAQITILDALLKMRQACCDPSLLKREDGQVSLPSAVGSAKRERLLEMLEALIGEGRRVLVFSQFTTMLGLIARDIGDRGWDYEMLTGQTKDRDAAVARFQSGAVPLFLVSLKAGGTGLTLTAADTVILYDPWWNPAAERQAMDRAHRIGQTQQVFVYRLVAEGTVEEAILALQARKQALADALFEGGAGAGSALDMETLAELFGPRPG